MLENNLEIKKPYYEMPLVGQYQLISTNQEYFQIRADEVLDLLNKYELFPANRSELIAGFKLPNGQIIQEIF